MQEQINRLARQTGDRATARALLHGKSEGEAAELGAAEAETVARRLTTHVRLFGCLPRPAALPELAERSEPVAPPVVHIAHTMVLDVGEGSVPGLDELETWIAARAPVRFTDG